MRSELEASLRTALADLQPSVLVRPYLPSEPPDLIVAVGKAALQMTGAAREAFPEVPWIATPPLGQTDEETAAAAEAGTGVIMPGAHPLPDANSRSAAEHVLERVSSMHANESLLLLVSGGGSSLWCAPAGIELEEKRRVVDQLMRGGADIFELNCVRKHLSRIKGGRLLTQFKGHVLSLIISDVPGDDAAVVASGVAAPDGTTYADALNVLDRFRIDSPGARAHLQRGAAGKLPAAPGPTDAVWERSVSHIIGSNRLLLEAAKEYWHSRGIPALILSDRLVGEARELARSHANLVETLRAGGRLEEAVSQLALDPGSISAIGDGVRGPIALLSGGETTVTVKGSGSGGRNQEFMLWLLHFLGEQGVWALSAGSDGIDGNSEAAGAVLRPDSWTRARELGLDPLEYLERNDSNPFFTALQDSVVTGQTGNNLNDYRVVLVDEPEHGWR